jgi:hypothetical protein
VIHITVDLIILIATAWSVTHTSNSESMPGCAKCTYTPPFKSQSKSTFTAVLFEEYSVTLQHNSASTSTY